MVFEEDEEPSEAISMGGARRSNVLTWLEATVEVLDEWRSEESMWEEGRGGAKTIGGEAMVGREGAKLRSRRGVLLKKKDREFSEDVSGVYREEERKNEPGVHGRVLNARRIGRDGESRSADRPV